MNLLIAGLALWCGMHFIPSLAFPFRQQLIAKFGKKFYSLMFAISIALSIVMMVLGWRSVELASIYIPPAHGTLVTPLLMIGTFILFAASHAKTNIKRTIRHPMLTGLIVWSIAHLLSNGDNRSLALFGILGIWAIVEIVLINKRDGEWVKPEPAPLKSEIVVLVKGVVVFAVFLFAHPYIFGVAVIPG